MLDSISSLNSDEVAHLLGVPSATVIRWAQQGKIPCKLKKNGYLFPKRKVVEWAKSHDFLLIKDEAPLSLIPEPEVLSLKNAVEHGGIFYHLPGDDITSVLTNALNRIPLPEGISKEILFTELINRENTASTGIGNGVAIPHPRNLLSVKLIKPVIYVVFLEKAVSYHAVDNLPVFVLFIMLNPTTQVHLKLLSRLSYCLRDGSFLEILSRQAGTSAIISEIERIEEELDKKRKGSIS